MNTAQQRASSGQLMSGTDYRESLRRYRPLVYVDGRRIESVADAPELQPGINALAVTYDFALDPAKAPLMTARQSWRRSPVNRMLHIDESAGDLLNKLEAVRLLCQETGCAQRYLAHDALNAIHQVSARIDDARGSSEHRARFAEYLTQVQDQDLALGIAMTDAKGDRSKRPHQQSRTPIPTCTSSNATARESSFPAPRRSSPAPRTCTSSWSCRVATWARKTPTSPSAAPYRWMPRV
jgi:4-hydroxybutyryl-CoA dehydratase/vinylacetyl-CoA-Delta-isomerase